MLLPKNDNVSSFLRKRILILALSVFIFSDLTRAKEEGEERKARPERGSRTGRAGRGQLPERRRSQDLGLWCEHHGKAQSLS